MFEDLVKTESAFSHANHEEEALDSLVGGRCNRHLRMDVWLGGGTVEWYCGYELGG